MSVPIAARDRGLVRGLCLATAATAAALAVAIPVSADAATVRSGEIAAFAMSSNPNITGHATMVRTASGTTIVSVHVAGLQPETTYPTHVHRQSCSDGFGGGHYMFDPAGPVAPPNEIWPLIETNAAGVGNGRAVVERTAGPTALAVVIHAPGGARIACADLAE